MHHIKIFFVVFFSIFLAELGDKTQLATLLFASDKNTNKWIVFFGASLALVTTSAIGVLLGDVVSKYVNPKYLNYLSGAGFIVIGLLLIISNR